MTREPAKPSHLYKSVVCTCKRSYIVFTGATNDTARMVKHLAELTNATFIDARQTPFILCACGQALNFAGESSGTVQ